MPEVFYKPDVRDISDATLPRVLKWLRNPPTVLDTTTIYAPSWNYLNLSGPNLEGEFTTYPGYLDISYDVMTNTVPSSVGAVVYLPLVANRFNVPLNKGIGSELIQDGGFESGTAAKWITSAVWSISSTEKHGGTYSIYNPGTAAELRGTKAAVSASKSYVYSFWYKVTVASATASWTPRVVWYDSAGTKIRTDTLATISDATDWTNVTGSLSAPSNATHATYQVEGGGNPAYPVIYMDDFSLLGTSASRSSLDFFAVVGRFRDGTLTPYSEWLRPKKQSQVLGPAGGLNLELDPSDSSIKSNRFAETGLGAKFDADGIRGSHFRLGSLIGWGSFTEGNDDSIARGLSYDESTWWGLAIGEVGAGQANIVVTAGKIQIRNNVTDVIVFDTTESRIDNLLKMSGASAAISIGSTPPTSSSAGTGIWLDRTGLYGLNANTLQAKFDATTGKITAGAGGIVLSSLGFEVHSTGEAGTYAKWFNSDITTYTGALGFVNLQKTDPDSQTYGVLNIGYFLDANNQPTMSFYKDKIDIAILSGGVWYYPILLTTTVVTFEDDIYVTNDCSALTFTDRTKFFDGDALSEIAKIKGKGGEIDHSTLPAFTRRILKKNVYKEVNALTDMGHKTKKRVKTGTVAEEGRDLGATVSMLVRAVQQLNERVK